MNRSKMFGHCSTEVGQGLDLWEVHLANLVAAPKYDHLAGLRVEGNLQGQDNDLATAGAVHFLKIVFKIDEFSYCKVFTAIANGFANIS